MTFRVCLALSAVILLAWALFPPPEPAWTADHPAPVYVPAPYALDPECPLSAPCITPSLWRPQ